MKDPKIHSGMYPGLEQLPTPELEELLRQDFAAGEGQSNLELVTAILEVIAQREALPQPSEETDAAWQQVRARAIEETAAPVPSQEAAAPVSMSQQRPKRRIAPRRAIAVAAVVCVLVCLLALPVQGQSLLQTLVDWTETTFSFLPENTTEEGGTTLPSQANPSFPQREDFDSDVAFDQAMHQQMKETIAGITELPLLPTWYPEGSRIIRVEELPLENGYQFIVILALEEDEYTMSFAIYNEAEDMFTYQYEKNGGSVQEYYSNGIPHYIMGNMSRNRVVWRNGPAECSIQGFLTVEELQKMIDSIYE